MKRMLKSIAHNYRAHKDEILNSAQRIAEALGGIEQFRTGGPKAGASIAQSIIESTGRKFDRQHGGFGNAPTFPHPSALDLLLDVYLETRQSWLLNAVTTTLEGMGRGGVYDQIGGGFHRYSVDERWTVPHFEKMSYDNAGLLVNYLGAYNVTGNEFFRQIALGILSFIEAVLASPEGGFYASQDADYSLDDDGDYFTWTLDEVKSALSPDEARIMELYYDVEANGEMHHNPAKNVLWVAKEPREIASQLGIEESSALLTIARAKQKMLAARLPRPTPYIDKTMYASWNAMFVSA